MTIQKSVWNPRKGSSFLAIISGSSRELRGSNVGRRTLRFLVVTIDVVEMALYPSIELGVPGLVLERVLAREVALELLFNSDVVPILDRSAS